MVPSCRLITTCVSGVSDRGSFVASPLAFTKEAIVPRVVCLPSFVVNSISWADSVNETRMLPTSKIAFASIFGVSNIVQRREVDMQSRWIWSSRKRVTLGNAVGHQLSDIILTGNNPKCRISFMECGLPWFGRSGWSWLRHQVLWIRRVPW